jgi:hypothetical protein
VSNDSGEWLAPVSLRGSVLAVRGFVQAGRAALGCVRLSPRSLGSPNSAECQVFGDSEARVRFGLPKHDEAPGVVV